MANMKNKIRTVTSKITIAGLAGTGTLAVLLCSGCAKTPEPQPEAVSEVVVEVSETPSEIETSEQSSEEISEVVPVVVELPELPILDENGDVYVSNEFTAEDIYAAIERMEPYCGTDYQRDKMVAMMLYYNGSQIDDATFNQIREDYLGNFDEGNIRVYVGDIEQIMHEGNDKFPISSLLIDQKESETFAEFEKYLISPECDKDVACDILYPYFIKCFENPEYQNSMFGMLIKISELRGYDDDATFEKYGLDFDTYMDGYDPFWQKSNISRKRFSDNTDVPTPYVSSHEK